MERNIIDLFSEMASTEMLLHSYVKEKKNEEDWDYEEDVLYNGLSAKVDAVKKVRECLAMDEKYDYYKIMILDSQMSYIESSGKFSESDIMYYITNFDVNHFDFSFFKMNMNLTFDIFEKGWSWTELDKYIDKDGYDHEQCRLLSGIIHEDYEIQMKLDESYLSEEEAKHHNIEHPSEYRCPECGSKFYARYRSKYSTDPKCPVCKM